MESLITYSLSRQEGGKFTLFISQGKRYKKEGEKGREIGRREREREEKVKKNVI